VLKLGSYVNKVSKLVYDVNCVLFVSFLVKACANEYLNNINLYLHINYYVSNKYIKNYYFKFQST